MNEGSINYRYFGWSGFEYRWPSGTTFIIDPGEGLELPDSSFAVFITHGHPEHFSGLLNHLKHKRTNAITVIASSSVCKYLKKKSNFGVHSIDQYVVCKPNMAVSYKDLTIELFGWKHMPLLPPGIWPAVNHLYKIMSNPRLAVKIATSGLFGPKASPMLGCRILSQGMPAIVHYSEGLHRKVKQSELDATLQSGDLLFFGIEPEDQDAITSILSKRQIRACFCYEPHKSWRECFGMPVVNKDKFLAGLGHKKHSTTLLNPSSNFESIQLQN